MIEPTRIHTLMIIDDDEVDQMLYQRIIKRAGIVDVTIAFRLAEEALEYLRRTDREHVDLIALDINMPRMNGLEFLAAATKELGDTFSSSVVVMLTTSLDAKDEAYARSFEAVKAFESKPLTIEMIKTWSETVLNGSRGEPLAAGL